MTWSTWGAAGGIGVALFGLGTLTGWVLTHTRYANGHAERRINLVLGVAFTVIALAVTGDIVHLQSQFNQHVSTTMACSTEQTNALVRINEVRRDVDQAAVRYDVAQLAWVTSGRVDGNIHPDDPVFIELQSAIRNLSAKRVRMVEVYAQNPMQVCP